MGVFCSPSKVNFIFLRVKARKNGKETHTQMPLREEVKLVLDVSFPCAEN